MSENKFEIFLNNVVNRPLAVSSIFLAVGIITAKWLDSILLVLLSIILLFIILIAILNNFRAFSIFAIGIVLFYTLGAIGFSFRDNLNSNKFRDFYEKDSVIMGYIASEPEIKETKINYIVQTVGIEANGKTYKVSGKILLSTLSVKDGSTYEYGQEVRMQGKLRAPKGVRIPGGFNYQGYLAQSGISATLFAAEYNIKAGTVRHRNILVDIGNSARDRIVEIIDRSLPEEQAGLLNGMLIGYRKGLNETVQQAFSDAGLTHIMAVSGANIAFIVFPLLFLLKKFRINQRRANALVIAILILFIFITGFSPSVVRAVIMAILLLIGSILFRDTDVFTSLGFAAGIMLLFNPFTLFDIGFQLSFAATLSLVIFYPNIKKFLEIKHIPSFLADVLACTLAAQIGVLPITALYFNKVSVISIVSNLFVVPVTQIITIFGSIMAITGQVHIIFSKMIGLLNLPFLTFILYTVKISAGVPFATFRVVTPPMLLILIYYIGLLFFLWIKPMFKLKVKPAYYAAAVSIAALTLGVYLLIPKELSVVFLDVGQGDSAFIRTSSGKTVLIDGGGHEGDSKDISDIGETIVIPFLLDYGVTKLDAVVATHGHNDHAQGLKSVLQSFEVDNLFVPDNQNAGELKELLQIAKEKGIPIKRSQKGDTIKLDSRTVLEALYPESNFISMKDPLNDGSLVLKLIYGKTSVLFTGDIGMEAEAHILKEKTNVKADVLKVAHHGSPYSTGDGFISAVAPRAAVVSVGTNNFGHPSPATLERLDQAGVRVFRTDREGAVLLSSNGKSFKIQRTVKVN